MDLLLPFFPIKLSLISLKIRTRAIVSTWIFAGLFNSPSLIIADVVYTTVKTRFAATQENWVLRLKITYEGLPWLEDLHGGFTLLP